MKMSIVLLASLGATALLRNRSAAMRHGVLAAAIVCAAVTPLLGPLLPAWHLRLPGPASMQRIDQWTPTVSIRKVPRPGLSHADSNDSAPSQRTASDHFRTVTDGDLLWWLWLAGVGVSTFVIAIGLGRLGWLASRSHRLVHGRWNELAARISREYGLRRAVAVLQSDHPSLLVTWGVAPARIILPKGASEWSEDLMRTVLYHELAHIRRGDWIVQLAAECLRACYWFNPIVWIACRRLRLESEYACDDAVMNRGVAAPDYAACLLDLARTLNRPRTLLPASAMARRSSLERRISAMLNDHLNRKPMSKGAHAMTMVAVLALTAIVAAAQTFATLSGTVIDPQGAVLPDVRLTVSNAERAAKYEVRSNRTGQFEFVGLPVGDYLLEAQIAGFAIFRQALTVTGQNVDQRITLELGSLQETVTITDGPVDTDVSRPPVVQTGTPRPIPPCNNPATGGDPQIGGNIRPPKRVRDARPQYPQSLRGTGTSGVVVIDGHIGADGVVKDLQVRSTTHPDFAKAAVDAVSQWQWDSTLLNCTPVEVAITVTATFIHQP